MAIAGSVLLSGEHVSSDRLFLLVLMFIKTPDMPSEVLFRQLLATPRPKQALRFHLSAAPEVELIVQAVSSHELADGPSKNILAHMLSKCVVLKSGRPAFSSADRLVNLLSMSEFKQLSQEAFEVLSRISPMVSYVDCKEWSAKLEEGARHSTNFMLTHSLGMCFDLIVMPDRVITQDYPERFFAVPRNQLLDCHWLAYWAARKVYKETALDHDSEKRFVAEAKKITTGDIL